MIAQNKNTTILLGIIMMSLQNVAVASSMSGLRGSSLRESRDIIDSLDNDDKHESRTIFQGVASRGNDKEIPRELNVAGYNISIPVYMIGLSSITVKWVIPPGALTGVSTNNSPGIDIEFLRTTQTLGDLNSPVSYRYPICPGSNCVVGTGQKKFFREVAQNMGVGRFHARLVVTTQQNNNNGATATTKQIVATKRDAFSVDNIQYGCGPCTPPPVCSKCTPSPGYVYLP